MQNKTKKTRKKSKNLPTLKCEMQMQVLKEKIQHYETMNELKFL